MNEHAPLLPIIIVHYKTPTLLLECVQSVLKENYDRGLEVIIVDNGGLTAEAMDKLDTLLCVKYINSGYNAGFARANNLGIHQASGRYVMLINPDSAIVPGFLNTMTNCYQAYEKKERLGLMGCRIVDPENGQVFEYGSGIGFWGISNIVKQNPFYIWARRKKAITNNYTAKEYHYNNHLVDVVSGACVMVNKDRLVDENLFLDEDFFLYYEDVEWSFRWKKRGFTNRLCGETELLHINSASTSRFSHKSAQILVSQYLFLLKTNPKFIYVLGGVLIWINLKLNQFLTKKKDPQRYKELMDEQRLFSNYYFQLVKGTKPSKGKYLNYVDEEV